MTQDADRKIADLLTDLWQRHLPKLHERLDLLDRAATEAATGSLTESTRLEALSVAHKLAGNLGMFGHQQATEIASRMEHILKTPTPETLVTLSTLANTLRESLSSSL